MPKIYTNASFIPEIGGRVIGGTGVLLNSPDEVPAMLSFIEKMVQPPEAPLASLYRILSDPRTSLEDWLKHFRATRPSVLSQITKGSPNPNRFWLSNSYKGDGSEPSVLTSDLTAL